MAKLIGRQSGTVTISAPATSATASPTSYTLARTILQYTYRGGLDRPDQGSVRGEKTNTTTLTFSREVGTSGTCVIEWRLMEFDADVNVQDINMPAPGASSSTAAISAVTLSRSFILSGGIQTGGGDFGENDWTLFKFNSTIEIEEQKGASWSVGSLEVQVVDFIGTSVQEVLHQEVAWTGTSTTDVIASVDTGKTWVISSFKTPTSRKDRKLQTKSHG